LFGVAVPAERLTKKKKKGKPYRPFFFYKKKGKSMNITKKIRDAINNLSASLTDEQFFKSPEFAEYLRTILKTALGKHARRRVVLHVIYDNREDAPAGFTNGEVVVVNPASDLVSRGANRMEKYLLTLGLLIHEVGHRLFTDFKFMNEFLTQWVAALTNPLQEPLCPVTDDPRWDIMLEELREFPRLREFFIQDVKSVQNICEDGYIENRLFEWFSGVFMMALSFLNRVLFGDRMTLSERFDEIIAEGDREKKDIMFLKLVLENEILRNMKDAPEEKGHWESDPEKDQLYDRMNQFESLISPILEELKFERASEVRCELINQLMLELYDYYPGRPDEDDKKDEEKSSEEGKSESKEKSGSGESESGSSSSDGGGDEPTPRKRSSDLSGDAEKTGKECVPTGTTAAPVGWSAAIDEEETEAESEKTKEEVKEEKERSDELSGSDAAIREFESAMDDIKKAMAEAIVEEEHNEELNEEASEIFRDVKPTGGLPEPWHYAIHRDSSEEAKSNASRYETIMGEVRKTAETSKRKLLTVLTKREEMSSSKGYQIGRFDPTSYGRASLIGDGRTFRQNRLPNGKPSVAFSILIDESGSMCGPKIETARRSAILLNDILTGVDVAHMIVGHTAHRNTCDILVYHDFDEPDRVDKYRLADIDDRNGNRDGAAIAYCCEKLLKRPEADKILIVISDGLPTECGFFSYDAREDTEMTIEKYRKKKVKIIGAIIDDYKYIAEIYGKMNCLDLTDLDKMPGELSSLVKRFILR
jgi:hypothetical protein